MAPVGHGVVVSMTEQKIQHSGSVLPASQALAFHADVSEALSSSLDYSSTLRRVTRLAVPRLADWCGLFLLGDEATGEQEITSGHDDPEAEALLREIRRRRRERDGASESRRVAESGVPILAHDVSAWDGDDEEIGDEQRAIIARLAPKSYMLVPLRAHGRPLGSMTLLSTREGRHYTEDDLAFVQTLAARCALAIDNARVHAAAERSLRLLDTIFATAPVGLGFVDRDLRVVHVNETLAGFNGRAVAEEVGRTLDELLGESAPEVVAAHRRVLETGDAIHDHEVTAVTDALLHDVRHWTVSYTPVRDAEGAILGVSAVVIDVTERRRLLEAEREARVRADFLARAGSLLDQSLDYERTLRAVTEIAVPDVADWCAVSILADGGALRQVAAAHIDPAQRELGEELNRRFPPDARPGNAAVRVVQTGETEFVREITDDMLVAGIQDPEQLDMVRRLNLRSIIIAPLQARGRMLGTLTLASAESGRLFDEPDVQLAEELARRAGLAIDNARLYTERSRIAHTLQVKLLPERLPDIPGAVVAARYRAAGELNEVGGDFYDVFPRSDREWAMVVGDVSGKGAEAAAITALARYTLRAAAIDHERPSDALIRLNTAMLAHEDPGQFITAVTVYLAGVGPEGMRARLALAGHPAPMIVRTDGTVEAVGAFGTMLGLRGDVALHDRDLLLARGDVLLLYTDGVTEAGPRGEPFGDEGLRRMLTTVAGRSPQDVVDAVERAVLEFQHGQPRDDIALLALALN